MYFKIMYNITTLECIPTSDGSSTMQNHNYFCTKLIASQFLVKYDALSQMCLKSFHVSDCLRLTHSPPLIEKFLSIERAILCGPLPFLNIFEQT